MNNEELAKKAFRNLAVVMAVKWAIVFGVTRSLKKAAEKQT